MTATTSGPAPALSVAVRIIHAAEGLRSRGAEPRRALEIVLREGDAGAMPPEIEATARAIWAAAIAGPGAPATLAALARILACADMLCSLGVEPGEAINVLRWVDAPSELEPIARDAWAVAVGSGAVVRVAWSLAVPPGGSRPGAVAVVEALSRILALAELLRSSGAEAREVITVLRWISMPRGLAAAVRAAWAFAVGLDDDGDGGRVAAWDPSAP